MTTHPEKLDPSLIISKDTLALLSGVTRLGLVRDDLTPQFIFFVTLVIAAKGAMLADGSISPDEEKYLLHIFDIVPAADNKLRTLVSNLIANLTPDTIFQHYEVWDELPYLLSNSERLVILSLCFEIAYTDGTIETRERDYLNFVAQSLAIDHEMVALIEGSVTGKTVISFENVPDLRALLHPDNFKDLGIRLASPATIDLLSRLSDKQLGQLTTSPKIEVVFTLTLLSFGVMTSDKNLEWSEQNRLYHLLNNLIPSQDETRLIMKTVVETLQSTPRLWHPTNWLKITDSLLESEKLLALCFAYSMALADGVFQPVEDEYLQNAAQAMHLDPKYPEVLRAVFTGQPTVDQDIWIELQDKIHPDRFQHLGPSIEDAASRLLDELATIVTEEIGDTSDSIIPSASIPTIEFPSISTFSPELKENQSLLLNEIRMPIFILSGLVHVFAIPLTQAGYEGSRHYLFTLSAGQLVFGFQVAETVADTRSYRFLAVADKLTSLHPIVVQADGDWMTLLSEYVSVSTSKIAVGVRDWCAKLSSICNNTITPPAATTNQDILGNWFQLSTHLQNYHVDFLQRFDWFMQQKEQHRQSQFESRQALNQRLTSQAIYELATILKPTLPEPPQTDQLLLRVANVVGRRMGIKVHPPTQMAQLRTDEDAIQAIARASKVQFRRVILEDAWWKTDGGSLIGFTLEGNPVGLITTGTGYQIFEPSQNLYTNADAKTVQNLDGTAFMFYRPLTTQGARVMDMINFALEGRRKDLVTIVLASILATLLGMLVPQATAILVDRAIPNADRSLLIQMGLGLLAAACGVALSNLAKSQASLHLTTTMSTTVQPAIWDRLLKLRLSFFRQYSVGDLSQRASSVSQIQQTLSGGTLQTLLNSLFALLNLGLMLYYSAQLTGIVVCSTIIVISLTTLASWRIRRKLRQQLELVSKTFSTTLQLITGLSKIRVAAAEGRAFSHWAKYYSDRLRLLLSTEYIEDLMIVFNTFAPVITTVFIFWWVTTYLTDSGLSIGVFLGFNTAYGIFFNGATGLSNVFLELLDIGVLWDRVKPLLEAEPELTFSKADPSQLTGKLKLDRVSFRYNPFGTLVLDHVTIEANPGEFIAVVGPSGSGKSTLVRLLLGFEVPEEGTVYYDDQDLSYLDLTLVRRQLGVVLQSGTVNNASVFDNIAGGAITTMDKAWTAAKLAGLEEDIKAMPMGMHTIVSHGGSNLSGGQRQRLLIARALVHTPQILIFDEATSALDNRTQAIVSQSLSTLPVTRIVIAHRLSTIQKADRIYVLESGRVVQQGTFDELIQQQGLFSQLMSRQIA